MTKQNAKEQRVRVPTPAMKRLTDAPTDKIMQRLFGKKLADAAKKVVAARDDAAAQD